MFKVERRYVEREHFQYNRGGYYEFWVTEYDDMGFIYDEFGWMPESEYREWKQTIIEETFPHSE